MAVVSLDTGNGTTGVADTQNAARTAIQLTLNRRLVFKQVMAKRLPCFDGIGSVGFRQSSVVRKARETPAVVEMRTGTCWCISGGGGIRTPVTLAGQPVFKTGAF